MEFLTGEIWWVKLKHKSSKTVIPYQVHQTLTEVTSSNQKEGWGHSFFFIMYPNTPLKGTCAYIGYKRTNPTQIIKNLTLGNIFSIHSTCMDEFLDIRINSFIVNFCFEAAKFDMSTCAFKRCIRVLKIQTVRYDPSADKLGIKILSLKMVYGLYAELFLDFKNAVKS